MDKVLNEIPDRVLEEIGCLRLKHVLKLIPMSRARWLDGVKKGEFPKPTKLGARTTVWRVKDLKQFIDESFQNSQL